ncbi:hypothetical protein GOV14_01745 [Candidatus Pacearchaeota archaeon]|nr:hypothetical protein [Candidatus Pacearchaeota archaeon]
MKNKQDFICPKCGSNNWGVGLIDRNSGTIYKVSMNNKKCKDCGFVGLFPVKSESNLDEKDKEILQEIEDIKNNKKVKF